MRFVALTLTPLVILLSATAAPQRSPEWKLLFSEPFANGLDGWETLGGTWHADAGKLTGSDTGNSSVFAYPALLPSRGTITVEAILSADQRLCSGGWNFGGITILQDTSNFWMLALTESPTGDRYVDFLESYRGTWQAQNAVETRLDPVTKMEKALQWQPGLNYRLRLVLTRERVTGTVLDATSGKVLCEGAYAFNGAPAIRSGFAGLILRGTRASFDDVTVQALPVPQQTNGVEAKRGPSGAVAIFRDALPGTDSAVASTIWKRLGHEGFGVTYLNAEQACNATTLSGALFDIYVIPFCHTYPAAGMEPLASFARERGHVLFLGGPLLTNPVWRCDDKWLTKDGLQALKNGVSPSHRPFTPGDVTSRPWSRATSKPGAPGHWKVVPTGPGGTPCLEYWSSAYSGWDGYLSPKLPTLFGQDHDLLTFRAKGDATTSQVAVEIQETDGSRWIAAGSISQTWQRIGLALSDFPYWRDSPTKDRRGGPNDRLNPQKAERINFGLAGTHTPLVPLGEHRFWIADLGTAPNPVAKLDGTDHASGPTLETISPSYKVYPVNTSVALRPTEWASNWRLPELPNARQMVMAIPRTSGGGFGRGQKWRYIPLYEGRDNSGHMRGAPVWCLINRTLPYTGSIFACFGFNEAQTYRRQPVLDAVVQVTRRLANELFLVEAGTAHFAYWPNEEVESGVRIQNLGAQDADISVKISCVGTGVANYTYQKTATQMLPAHRESTLREALALPAGGPATYHFRAELIHKGQVVDHIVHELAVLDPQLAAPAEFISVQGTNFVLKGRPWYPVGINFWPLYVSGMEHTDFWAGWLDRRCYEPALVEKDLKRMADQGLNMVSIQSNDPRFYRNLLDFVRRCKAHGIWVNLYCGLASPLAFREEKLCAFLTTARLHQNPTVFAYDTIWEPGNYVFRGSGRNKWDPDWRNWIEQQYGSVEKAEADWNVSAPRNDKGAVTSPPDKCFREDGQWRVLMAAYRRFMDDLTSRKWNDAHRRLRRLVPNQLVSFRQGNTLPHDFAFTGTPKHIDFICPEGYSIQHTDDGYNAAGFITRYVHFTSRGKPIIWSEFGKSVWNRSAMRMEPAIIETQGDYHDMFYRMCLESGANGTAPWWWPGGYRTGERSDYGIMNPDYTERPAAKLIRKYAAALKNPREWPAPTTWLDMDRDAHSGGYWYVVFNTGRDAYRKAVVAGKNLGIRSRGTGTTSANTPLVAVGNRPYNGNNPPKYLNAEINWFRILAADGSWTDVAARARIRVKQGRPVRAQVCVGNTQEATWLSPRDLSGKPGGVYLAATPASKLNGRWPIPADTPYLADADFGELTLVDSLTEETSVEMRMTADQRAWFGEKFRFVLVPTP